MTERYDLIVIGTGVAATTAASKCRNAGWNVAVIDSRPFGGTCVLRGCDPKKVLVGAEESIDWIRRLKGKGVRGDQVSIDWGELMRFKRTFTDPVPQNRKESFLRAGIDAYQDRAHFVGPTAMQVGTKTLEGRYILIAAGAKPKELDFPGAEYVTTSDKFMELETLPSRIVFIGGGYISFEFCHLAARAGAKVALLHRSERPLRQFDLDLVSLLMEETRRLGVDIRLKVDISEVGRTKDGLMIRFSESGQSRSILTDLVVHGAGRVPDIDDMELEKGGVEREERGVRVNEYLQSVSNPRVYSAGDAAASGLPLTPVASFEADIAAANLIDGNHKKAEYPPIPSTVFTLPPLASVGLLEEDARSAGLQFDTHYQSTSGWYTSRRIGEESSGYKVLVDKASGKILGAHLLGIHAEEMINLFALAMHAGLTAEKIREAIFAYPTKSSDITYML